MSNFQLLKKEFKEKILEFSTPFKMISIGSNSDKGKEDWVDYERDIDIIVVISNDMDCYEYSKKISPMLKSIIKLLIVQCLN